MQSTQYPTDVLLSIPSNLPIPLDDGACDRLEKTPMPDVYLMSTEDEKSVCRAYVDGMWFSVTQ